MRRTFVILFWGAFLSFQIFAAKNFIDHLSKIQSATQNGADTFIKSQKINQILSKTVKNIRLSLEELNFLYEIKEVLPQFLRNSEKYKKIVSARNRTEDMLTIFDIKVPKVARNIDILNHTRKNDLEERTDVLYLKYKKTLEEDYWKEGLTGFSATEASRRRFLSLSVEDLSFLYEPRHLLRNTEARMYSDFRIKEIIDSRDVRKDLAKIYNISKYEVGVSKNDLFIKDSKIKVYYGNLSFLGSDSIFSRVKNDLNYLGVTSSRKTLEFPEVFLGSISFIRLNELRVKHGVTQIIFPKNQIGNLVTGLRKTGVLLTRNKEVPKIRLPEYLGGSLKFVEVNPLISGKMPKFVGGDVDLQKVKLFADTIFSKFVGGDFLLADKNPGPHNSGSKFGVWDNNITEYPKVILGDAHLINVKVDDSFKMPYFGRSLIIGNIVNQDKKKVFQKVFHGNLDLGHVDKSKRARFILPRIIYGDFSHGYIYEGEGFYLPSIVYGTYGKSERYNYTGDIWIRLKSQENLEGKAIGYSEMMILEKDL